MFNIIVNQLNQNFYKWFGTSKVVDSNNQPMVMYHKSRCKDLFNEFRLENIEKNGYNLDYGVYFVNAYYSNNISYIGDGLEYHVFLKMENPFYIYDNNGQPYDMFGQTLIFIDLSKSYCEELQKKGFDGVIIKSSFYDQYVVFEPNQIKSIENNGSYCLETNDIFT
jgi:hypothetical protein